LPKDTFLIFLHRHAAASYGQLETIEYLISAGGNINVEDFDGDTPLFVVETPEVARFLIERGADPLHRNSEGSSAAMNAVSEGWREVAEEIAKDTGESLTEEQEDNDMSHVAMGDDENDEFMQQVHNVMQQTEEGQDRDDQLRGLVAQMVQRQIEEDKNQK
jgi:ankyrin repeat protein